jgi:hypothetical protein
MSMSVIAIFRQLRNHPSELSRNVCQVLTYFLLLWRLLLSLLLLLFLLLPPLLLFFPAPFLILFPLLWSLGLAS